MLCILYVNAVGFLLGVAGLLAERMLPLAAPRRWLWCAIIPVSLFLPGYYRFHHAMSVAVLPAPPTQGNALATSWAAATDLDFWARVESWNGTINLLWHVASAALILWGVAGACRVWRILRGSYAVSPHRPLATAIDGVDVLVTRSIGPATVGLLRSRVVVPRWVLALPAAQRGYVIRHEDEHRRAHDATLLFLASLTLVLAPWHLALWWQLRRLHLAVELDCDTRVVNALGDATAYGETLLAVAQAASRGPRLQPALLGIGSLERRLVALLDPTPLRRFERWLGPALVALILLVVLALPHPVVEHGTHGTPTHDARASHR
jgi:beta-lactamase regulating signal transducer with metallopeptidase domain